MKCKALPLGGAFRCQSVRGHMSTDFEHSIISPVLKVVAAHWLAVRRGREMPAWASLMPSALKLQLPYVWAYIYEPSTDSFTGRLAGDRVSAIFGKNFHGLLSVLAAQNKSPRRSRSRAFLYARY